MKPNPRNPYCFLLHFNIQDKDIGNWGGFLGSELMFCPEMHHKNISTRWFPLTSAVPRNNKSNLLLSVMDHLYQACARWFYNTSRNGEKDSLLVLNINAVSIIVSKRVTDLYRLLCVSYSNVLNCTNLSVFLWNQVLLQDSLLPQKVFLSPWIR